MFRAFVVAAAIVAVPVLSPSGLLGQQAPPSSMRGHRAMPTPVNLEVLPKNISPQDLLKIMHGFTQQLGVHCSFCHVEDPATHHTDFASDAKPTKDTARTMMRMTGAINATYLAQIHDTDVPLAQKTVTCGTCHRGNSVPQLFTSPARSPEHTMPSTSAIPPTH